jgi:hypothetical protein
MADDANISKTLSKIRDLRKDGHFTEAWALAEDLAKQFPAHPAVLAARRTSFVANNVSRIQQLNADRNRGDAGVQAELEQSATPPTRDVDFPKNWQERVKNRVRGTPFTDKEKAILQALNSTVVVKFKGEAFENAIKALSEKIQQPILVDRMALEEAQVKYDTPVSLETPANGMAARTILRRLLGDYGLAYVIKDQSIEVTTAIKAKNLMVVRSYFIGDLLNNPSLAAALGQPQLAYATPGTPWWLNPSVSQSLVVQQATHIMDMIKESIEPDSWRIGGGGNITFHPATMSLVIRQSTEVHGMLSSGLLR